jgi:hypothetical protein
LSIAPVATIRWSVGDFGAVFEHDLALRRLDALRFAEQHGGILLVREDMADRRRDRRRGEAGGRDLVQQAAGTRGGSSDRAP